MLLSEIAEVSRTVATTGARLAKIETLAGALRAAGPLEVPIAVAYLSGELPQLILQPLDPQFRILVIRLRESL